MRFKETAGALRRHAASLPRRTRKLPARWDDHYPERRAMRAKNWRLMALRLPHAFALC